MDLKKYKQNTIQLEPTFSTAINYILISILLSSITIFPIIQTIASTICLYLGLRLIKNLNNEFRFAYYISILILIYSFLTSILQITSPLEIPNSLIVIAYILNLIKIFMIAKGINHYIKDNEAIWFGTIYVASQILGVFLLVNEGRLLILIIAIICLFFSVMYLWMCKNEIEDIDNDISLLKTKTSSFLFIMICCFTICIGSFISPYIWPLFSHSYATSVEPLDYGRLIEENDDFKVLDKVTVYESNEKEYTVIIKMKNNDKNKYSFVDTEVLVNAARGNNHLYSLPQNVSIKNSNGILETNIISLSNKSRLFNIENAEAYRTYFDPLEGNEEITINITIYKGVFNEENEESELNSEDCHISVNTHFYEYGKIPNDPSIYNDYFSIDKDGKIKI